MAAPAPDRLSLQDGQVLWENYRLVQFLGNGSFGQVWEAKNPQGKHVALKFLRCSASDTGTALEIRNIQRIRMLRHPNLIQLISNE